LKKLEKRDKKKYEELKNINFKNIEPNPVFQMVEGGIEEWEKTSSSQKYNRRSNASLNT